MPTEEKNPAGEVAAPLEAAPPGPTRSKKALLLGGGVASLIALAWVLSLVAVPGKSALVDHPIGGPFVADISPTSGFQVNLAGDGGKHYLSMNVKAEVDAFDEAYVTAHASEPLYQAKLTDAILRIASQKTKSELDNLVGREILREELRVALDPVLFPVHVGSEHEGRHEASGLRAGRSIDRSTLRGFFHEHELELDAAKRTARLDDGAPVSFRGDEADLFVADAQGKGVYLDMTGLDHDFEGKVHIGTFGRVRNVYFGSFLTQ